MGHKTADHRRGRKCRKSEKLGGCKAIAPSLDYINLMTYDMAYGTQYFNSNLYDSTQWPTVAAADKYSADFVVSNYLAAGLKPSQMNLGIGFMDAYQNAPLSRVLTGANLTRRKPGYPALFRVSSN